MKVTQDQTTALTAPIVLLLASIMNLSRKHQYFSIIQYNVQSLLPKLDIIESELSKFDIVAITETWLDETISDNDISLTCFKNPYRCDRPGDAHAGVAVYIRDFRGFLCLLPLSDRSQTGRKSLTDNVLNIFK